MIDFFNAFVPHGHCFLWNPWILWGLVLGHGVTAASYLLIPMEMYRFRRLRPDWTHGKTWLLYASFIVLCGGTHALAILTIWHGYYGYYAVLVALTGTVSAFTYYFLHAAIPVAARRLPHVKTLMLRSEYIENKLRRMEEHIEDQEPVPDLLDELEEIKRFVLEVKETVSGKSLSERQATYFK